MFAHTGGPGSPNFIPLTTWSGLIHNDIIRQCDTIDKVADGTCSSHMRSIIRFSEGITHRHLNLYTPSQEK